MGLLNRIFPPETRFFEYFERHAELTVSAAREFLALAENGDNIAGRARRIKEIEHETDVITHRCVEALHKTFITPIERDDIYRLITKMDDIMDFIESASERIALYELKVMTPEVIDLSDTLVRQTQEVEEAIRGLRDLKHPKRILEKCVDINRLENEADAILRRALARMFKEEKDAILIIKWKEVYEHLENATDRAEDVANIIEGAVLDNA
jgi:predicted phosphate transport protein (TIGR00153 family)